jgi:uncharacterized protein
MPVPMAPETRSLSAPELRVEDAADKPVIVGYAAVFNSLSEDLGGFREVIRPGAFAKGLAGADVRALVNHDPTLILGRNKAGTLKLAEDSRGLRVEIDPPDTQAGRDVLTSIRRGDIDGMSFRFYVAEGGEAWRSEPSGMIRELTDVEVDDVSIALYPAYRATEVSVRCLESLESFRRSQPRRTPLRDRAGRLLRLIQADR